MLKKEIYGIYCLLFLKSRLKDYEVEKFAEMVLEDL